MTVANADRWYEEYVEAPVKQQYQMLLDIMQQPLDTDFLETTEMAELLINMSDELHSNNLSTEALNLINLVKQKQPKFYKQEFSFYDKFLVEYYLYTRQENLVADALARFKKYPQKDIEQLFVVLDLLAFYDRSELAVDLCRTTYNKVKNEADIIAGAEDKLAWVIITYLMEQAYQQHQQGKTINWTQFNTELNQFGYGDRDWLEDMQATLTNKFDPELFQSQIKQNKTRSSAFNRLSTTFYIYLKIEKQISFVCSQAIWEAIFEFLGDRDLNQNQQANPHRFFTFSQSDLEPYLSQKINGFFSLQQAQGFATLWGIPYLYDFLLEQEIIRPQLHSKIITITNQLKKELLEVYKTNWQLWRYDFVNRWQPDNNQEASVLTQQKQIFTDSFNYSEPLSNEPGGGKVESFFDEMSEKLGFNLSELQEELAKENEELLSAEPESVTKKEIVLKPKSKKKKSNLSLAAKLYNK